MNSYLSVIVTYNRKDKLKKAIECLKKQTFKPEKIIIIDNASTDGTQDILKVCSFRRKPWRGWGLLLWRKRSIKLRC